MQSLRYYFLLILVTAVTGYFALELFLPDDFLINREAKNEHTIDIDREFANTYDLEKYTIKTNDQTPTYIDELGKRLDANIGSMKYTLNMVDIPRVTFMIYTSPETFKSAADLQEGMETTVGISISESEIMMVSPDYYDAPQLREELIRIALHEYTHCLVQYKYPDMIYTDVRWLNEAIACHQGGMTYYDDCLAYMSEHQPPTIGRLYNDEVDGLDVMYSLGSVFIDYFF